MFLSSLNLDSLSSVDYDGNNRQQFKFMEHSSISWWNTISIFSNDDIIYLLTRQVLPNSMAKNKPINSTMTSENNHPTGTILTQSLIQINNKQMISINHKMRDWIKATLMINNIETNIRIKSDPVGALKNQTIKDKNKMLNLNWYKPVLIYSRLNPGLIKLRQLDSLVSLNDDNDGGGRWKQQTTKTVPITHSQAPITFDIDPFEKNIYYIDDYDSILLYHHLNLVQSKIISSNKSTRLIKCLDLKLYGINERSIESISFDWCNRNIYLLEKESISVINMDQNYKNNATNFFKKTLINELIEPSALTLDPKNGLMFFASTTINTNNKTDQQGKTLNYLNTISRSNMDGTDVIVLIELIKSYASSLTVDAKHQHLYWPDTLDKTIQRINYNGADKVVLIKSSKINLANSMSFFNDTLFWTEIQHGTIQKLDLNTNKTEFILQEWAPLFQIKVFESMCKQSTFYELHCSNNEKYNCEQLKLRTAGVDSVCACDDHFELNQSGQCRLLSSIELTKKFCSTNQIYSIEQRKCIKENNVDNAIES